MGWSRLRIELLGEPRVLHDGAEIDLPASRKTRALLGYLVATWVQSRATAARTALVFTLEAPFAALFGVLLLSEQLGWAGWLGCAVMLGGILLAEPAAASVLRRLVPARA